LFKFVFKANKLKLFTRNNFSIFFIGWWFLWAIIHFFILTFYGFNFIIAFGDSFINNIILAAFGLAMNNILRFYRPDKNNFFLLFVWCIIIALLASGLFQWLILKIFAAQSIYVDFLINSIPLRFLFALLMTGCLTLVSWFIHSANENAKNEEHKIEIENMAKEAELSKLRQQLQPHFLFNSLNSINSLIGSRPDEARKMVQQLSEFLRGTMKKEDNQISLLSEEIQQIELYLNIEKVRFGHRLSTQFNIDENTLKAQIPALLLQPLLENAIKFGLYGTTDGIIISLSAQLENDFLIISISNPFDEKGSANSVGTGFGIKSVKKRLFLIYSRNDLLKTEFINEIFTVTLKIPQQNAQVHNN